VIAPQLEVPPALPGAVEAESPVAAPPPWAQAATPPPPPPTAWAPPAQPAPPPGAYPAAFQAVAAPDPAGVPGAPSASAPSAGGFKVTPKLLAVVGIAVAVVAVVVYLAMGSSKSSGITVTPQTFSCSSSMDVMSAIKLPSSLRSTDVMVVTVDGEVQRTTTVGTYMNPQSDGTWTRESVSSASDACQGVNGQIKTGTHSVRIADLNGRVLAEGTYTTTP
jgi:hypothetical protein